jgi:hypothetical protein
VRRRWNAARYRRSHGVRFGTAPQILELGEAFAGGQYFMTGNGRWEEVEAGWAGDAHQRATIPRRACRADSRAGAVIRTQGVTATALARFGRKCQAGAAMDGHAQDNIQESVRKTRK